MEIGSNLKTGSTDNEVPVPEVKTNGTVAPVSHGTPGNQRTMGSNASLGPVDNSLVSPKGGSSMKAQRAIRLAEIRESSLRQCLELERELLQVQEAAALAKEELKQEIEGGNTQSDIPDSVSCQKSTQEYVNGFLSDYTMQIGVQDSKYEVPRGEQQRNTMMNPSMDLPKFELCYFDGNPQHYWAFIRQFENFIEPRLTDPGQRLLYLRHYCQGFARESIEGCLILHPSEGYSRARGILADMFGQPHSVAKVLIEGLVEHTREVPNTPEAMNKFSIKLTNCEMTLGQIKLTSDLNSSVTLEKIVRALPKPLQYKWARSADGIIRQGLEPVFSDLCTFIGDNARVLNNRYGQIAATHDQRKTHPQPRGSDEPKVTRFVRSATFATTSGATIREYCGEGHATHACAQFLACTVLERREVTQQKGLCFLCLQRSHKASVCRSKIKCDVGYCNGRHNPLLHLSKPEVPRVATTNGVVCATTCRRHNVRFGVVPVNVVTPSGMVSTYAFIDNGSDTTLVRRTFLDRVGIVGKETPMTLSTINGEITVASVRTSLGLSSLDNEHTVELDDVYAVTDIPIEAANVQIEASKWRHLEDIKFSELPNKEVDLLIGCNASEAHWVLDQRVGRRNEPFAIRTLLGWILYGTSNGGDIKMLNLITEINDPLVHQLRTMYENDFLDAPCDGKTMSVEDKTALRKVEGEVRLVDCHLEVPVPWRDAIDTYESNYEGALKRLMSLKRRLTRDPELLDRYSAVIQGHVARGFVEVSNPTGVTNKLCWYLPHHPVLNPKKPGKVRVVFDCSAKFKGVSLNDRIYTGPAITSSLIGVLLRFRQGSIAVSGDIEEMFLQVRMPVQDRGAFRFLWWRNNNPSDIVVEYRMTSHPFGASSSPFCAGCALQYSARQEQNPCDCIISEAIHRNFHVDDCLKSFHCQAEAKSFIDGITRTLANVGFRLRKWMSNDLDVLQSIAVPERAVPVVDMTPNDLPDASTLGLKWDAVSDEFLVSVQIASQPLTRRGCLSYLASVYDPLGFVSPWLLEGKRILQSLCREGMGWDEPMRIDEKIARSKWAERLRLLNEARIPRCILRRASEVHAMELHTFCDASEFAYGAVVYVRSVFSDGGISVSLVCSKSRVAPLKAVTIPRLELMAAVLGTKLSTMVQSELTESFVGRHLWTDSMIVLHYIRNTKTRFSVFVANRLAVIHELSDQSQWHHVRSADNPADVAYRGPFQQSSYEMWFEGPQFMKREKSRWPSEPKIEIEQNVVEVKGPSYQIHLLNTDNPTERILSYYSSWFKLVRSFAWLIRFKLYLRMKCRRDPSRIVCSPLSCHELLTAEMDIFRLIQRSSFSEEIRTLMEPDTKGQLQKRSTLRALTPMLVDGVIRVGGRLTYASVPYNTKHPIILLSRHHVVDILVEYFHLSEGHRGVSHVLATIRNRFWIVQGSKVVKRIVGRCFKCLRSKAKAAQQLMAPLPLIRTEPASHPFENTGVDYFGPILVKKGRGTEKRYGCLFTCFQTRAVHLEVATHQSAESFLMALARFVGRRGLPRTIFSDNAPNFVSASKEIRSWVSVIDEDVVRTSLAKRGIEWSFNPPYASHRGGVWERLIRSTEEIMNRVTDGQNMTDESLYTFLIEVQRILNNRPLVPYTGDDSEKLALRPNDLLLLRTNDGIPPIASTIDRYSRGWKQAQQLASTFWKRWSNEYLVTLLKRQRWLKKERNLRENDVVLVIGDEFSREQWPLGVIESCELNPQFLYRIDEFLYFLPYHSNPIVLEIMDHMKVLAKRIEKLYSAEFKWEPDTIEVLIRKDIERQVLSNDVDLTRMVNQRLGDFLMVAKRHGFIVPNCKMHLMVIPNHTAEKNSSDLRLRIISPGYAFDYVNQSDI